jgi:tetratricopeptide (TPR) repeat protein
LKPAPLKAVAPPVQEAVELRGLASSYAAPKEPTAPASVPASPLSGLLEEIGEAPGAEPVPEDDPETHYNLGVAFREMSLLDEAIGEFQKVVKGAGLKPRPPNYLQACTLLATCFMDKGMAPIAVKWYCRALETPNLDEEVLLALQYDLGVAYEQAGDLPRALEKFAEVYGQNIDFRDVAEKIRAFQQKGS